MSFKDWEDVLLGDLVKIKGGKRLPKGEVLIKDKTSHPYIRVRDLSDRRYLELDNQIEYLDEEVFNSISRYTVNEGDIVISIVGTIGLVSIIGKTLDGANLTENCVKLIELKNVNRDYLYYYLTSIYGKREFEKGTVGAVQAKLPIKNIQQVSIKLPNLSQQKAIADILSSLDDKIELNNQMNETLEEMAQALFKRWFVDFEFPNEEGQPYKSSGGEMVESELGMIPNGWSIGFFRDYMVDILGGDWGKEEATGNYNKAVYCLRGADIPEIRVGRKGKMSRRYILEKNYLKKKLTNGDLVVEISGGSPTQSTGRITYISKALLEKYDLDIVSTNFCRAITLKDIYMTEFYYYYWNYLYNNDVFFQYENGTTGIKNLDINSFLDKFSIVQPPKELLKIFHDKINIILLLVQANGEENEKLAHVRDTLLPKLMSGEIRVSDLN